MSTSEPLLFRRFRKRLKERREKPRTSKQEEDNYEIWIVHKKDVDTLKRIDPRVEVVSKIRSTAYAGEFYMYEVKVPKDKVDVLRSAITHSSVPKSVQTNPESGRTFEGQSDEFYCIECVEGHTMASLTEMRHALDRYRTAGKMTEGVTEKVRVSIAELTGINEDVKSTKDASPEVKRGLEEILDEVRWIRKEYGMSGKGLTRGYGNLEDLEELRNRIFILQSKAYALVEQCPACKPHIQTTMGKAVEERIRSG